MSAGAGVGETSGKAKKTPEEIADDDARTIPMGLFNTAEAFRLGSAPGG